MDAGELLSRNEDLEALRAPWESLWERVAELVLPRMNDFDETSPGQQRNLRQYDSFAMGALEKFAAAIEAGLMPRQTLWHRLSTGDEDLDNQHSVKIYLDELNNRLWKQRYSPLSKFASQAHEFRLMMGLYGTAAMYVEPRQDARGARYRTIHLAEISIDESEDGVIDTVHRKFKLTTRQAVQKFGKDTPQKILDKFHAGKMGETFEFLHCVCPREDYEKGALDFKGMKFGGYYIYIDQKQMVREEGFHENPYCVARYSVSTRERYGRGPAIQRMPDIAMLNEMKRTVIEQANMAVDPPTMSHEEVSEFDLMPGSHHPGTVDENGRPMVIPFNSGTQPSLALEQMADVRNQIDDGFLGVYFRVLLENPNMTATQAMLIAQQQGQMTAPVIGRMQSEWLSPLIRRESGILHRQGRHPQMPPELLEFLQETQEPFFIEYESPLTRAARAEEGVALLRSFESLAPFAQIDPTVYQTVDTEAAARLVFEVNGVPEKILKDPDQIAAEKQQAAAQAQMGAILDAAPVAAQTAKTLAEAQTIAAQPAVPNQ